MDKSMRRDRVQSMVVREDKILMEGNSIVFQAAELKMAKHLRKLLSEN